MHTYLFSIRMMLFIVSQKCNILSFLGNIAIVNCIVNFVTEISFVSIYIACSLNI